MRSQQIGQDEPRRWAVVLDTGDEVSEQLLRFAEAGQVRTAEFTAIGAFERVELGYYDVDAREYRNNPLDEQVEVLTMTGNIVSAGDRRQLHAHVVVGLRDATTRGGHLLRAWVRPTLEVMVTESPRELTRRHDEPSGLALIDLPA
ncbi:PPC domain-containing DNA-binding protein [Amycolatopsis anabasis]|uniref:PPC domain-containing DNA-binding protein n=1 Tax=Amycolatopsis anabasis TaxID=1840409 RepID=UPI00131AC0C2|nr:PPC domain-containing DNA-binding protein [Amycolatopsis anabasis]